MADYGRRIADLSVRKEWLTRGGQPITIMEKRSALWLRDSMRNLLKQVYHSPRAGLLRKLLGRYVRPGVATNQWLRVVMNEQTQKLVQSLNPSALNVLEISGRVWGERGPFKEYRSVRFPEFDICHDRLEEKFDLIIAEQVFEHLLWPSRAGKNVRHMLKPDGYFLITTPFLVRVHDFPTDCTRWTETGLKYFLVECGFSLEDVQVASWGNRSCVKSHLGRKWRIYRPWRHSLRNEPTFPVVVWALAKNSVTVDATPAGNSAMEVET